MRILLLSQYFYPEQFSNNTIARELVARGHHLQVVTGVPNYPEGVFFKGYSNRRRRVDTYSGIPVRRAYSIPRGRSKWKLVLNYLTFPITGTWTAIRHVRSADVVFVPIVSPLFQAIPAIVFKVIRRTPIVLWIQDIWPESALLTLNITNPIVVRPLTSLCGWIYRRADLLLVQSEAFPSMILSHGVAPGRLRVLPNTAPDYYRPLAPDDAPEEASMVPQSGFRLMFAGNIGESQDFETLIRAADILREEGALRWVIIGSGRALDSVKREVSRRNLNKAFEFLGRFPEERMPRFFAHADALLVSLKDLPIFSLTVPYKVQTYMACGKPIIGSLGGEGARIIRDAGAGLVAPPSNPAALAKAITDLMRAKPESRIQFGQNARRYYDKRYNSKRVFDDLERWLSEASEKFGR